MSIKTEFIEKIEEFISSYEKVNGLKITAVITASNEEDSYVASCLTGNNVSERDIVEKTMKAIEYAMDRVEEENLSKL